MTPKMTASIGIRWEYYPFPTRTDRGLEMFDFTTNLLQVCGIGAANPQVCDIKVQKDLFTPRLTGGLNYIRFSDPFFNFGTGDISPSASAASLEASYTVLGSGKLAALRSARASLRSAEAGETAARFGTALETDAAYFAGPVPERWMRFIEGPPTLAVEVRSENDYTPSAEQDMAEKRADYFAAGTLVVWDVDPIGETVAVYRSDDPTTPTILRRGDVADAEPAVPGWRMAVDDVFP